MLAATQASAATYCGMLGDHKIELDSRYFAMKPDYEGTSAWESSNFQPKEDCTSKLTVLSVHTNINTGEPSKPFSEKAFDIILAIRPAKDNLYLKRSSETIDQNKLNILINDSLDKKVYETKKNEYGGFERKVVYLDSGHVTEIIECTFNVISKGNICELIFDADNYHVSIAGSYESVKDFDKARSFSMDFLKKSRINK
jgi:hypothetical protein